MEVSIVSNAEQNVCPGCGADEFDYDIVKRRPDGMVLLRCSCRGECEEGERSFELLLAPEFADRFLDADEIDRETGEV